MAQSKNGQDAEVKFNFISTAMLMDYEDRLFAKSPRGAVNKLAHDINAAVDAGWIDEPFEGFTSGEWLQETPDPAKIHRLRDIDLAIDAKYAEFVTIDPNG
jgi:hypothetical protein